MVRLVLFDIDGTLIRTGGAGMRAFERTLAVEFGIEDGIRGVSFAGRTDTSLVREILTVHGLPATAESRARFLDRYVFLLDDQLARHQGLVCPGVRELLEGLAALPEPPVVGLQTGNIRLGAEIKLRHHGLWEHFTVGGFGDDSEDRRELTRIAWERAARCLGGPLDPAHVVVVGDTPHDVDCGHALGARVVAVATGGASRAELEAHRPRWVLDSLQEISAAALCA